jgi:hypothetical protein
MEVELSVCWVVGISIKAAINLHVFDVSKPPSLILLCIHPLLSPLLLLDFDIFDAFDIPLQCPLSL